MQPVSSIWIYRYGNEDKLSTLTGVMQALVSFVEDDNNHLRLAFRLGCSMSYIRVVYNRKLI